MKNFLKGLIYSWLFISIGIIIVVGMASTMPLQRKEFCEPPFHYVRYLGFPSIQIACFLGEEIE